MTESPRNCGDTMAGLWLSRPASSNLVDCALGVLSPPSSPGEDPAIQVSVSAALKNLDYRVLPLPRQPGNDGKKQAPHESVTRRTSGKFKPIAAPAALG